MCQVGYLQRLRPHFEDLSMLCTETIDVYYKIHTQHRNKVFRKICDVIISNLILYKLNG